MSESQPIPPGRRPSPAEQDGDLDALLPIRPEDKARLAILIIDDEPTLRESCASVLRHEGYNVTLCGRGDEALELLQRRAFDIVLVDLYMSQVPGMELLQMALTVRPETIVIVMTGNPSLASSLEALRAGAWDYLPKPFSATHLQILIGRAAHAVLVGRETAEARHQAFQPPAQPKRRAPGESTIQVIGNSPAFRRAIELATRVAPTDASVFITGESGTGKEMIAQYIHQNSRRRTRPMIAINCAALPETLLESEMFGHVKGAFTGAVRDKSGLLETANGGTMFLDELTEMSQAIQAKLLRVIQDGVVRRLGSSTVDAVVNIRFIAATNRDPQEATEAGILREDLYYRLRVVPIRMPPLRERVEDIPLLAEHFLAHYWARHREPDLPMPRFSREAIRALQARPWRGNVRELQNVIEHAVVLLDPGAEIKPEDLAFLDDEAPPTRPSSIISPEIMEQSYHPARERVLADFEREYLTWLVTRSGGNMSRAARMAGVDRTTLYRLMEKHGLQRGTILTSRQ